MSADNQFRLTTTCLVVNASVRSASAKQPSDGAGVDPVTLGLTCAGPPAQGGFGPVVHRAVGDVWAAVKQLLAALSGEGGYAQMR